MQVLKSRLSLVSLIGAIAVVAAVAAPAGAATTVYPEGGSTFSTDLEGWHVTEEACTVAVLCTASGGFEEEDGNPAGSIAGDTTVLLNLLELFTADVSFESAEFTAADTGPATLSLDRRFDPGGLEGLGAEVEYTVRLLDKTEASESTLFTESLSSETVWSGVEAGAEVQAGHAYALAIDAQTTSSGINLTVAGTSSARFDNVALSVETEEEGEGESPGGGSPAPAPTATPAPVMVPTSTSTSILTRAELRSIARRTIVTRVKVKGNRVFVRLKCPKRAGRACRFRIRGMLRKGRVATTTRNVRIGKGQGKRVVLRIKPKLRAKVAKRKRLLFKQTMRVGKAKTTSYRSLRLVRGFR